MEPGVEDWPHGLSFWPPFPHDEVQLADKGHGPGAKQKQKSPPKDAEMSPLP